MCVSLLWAVSMEFKNFPSLPVSICLSLCLSVRLSDVCLCVFLHISFSVYLFARLFAPVCGLYIHLPTCSSISFSACLLFSMFPMFFLRHEETGPYRGVTVSATQRPIEPFWVFPCDTHVFSSTTVVNI
ncbi:hypothetical protein CSKR_200020 [Clonorchis sinensis]|uniref:Uncharacterized protein n=1 Tax=Clonorchis sinensis TaxID=79923 RepID=A0A8T1LY58_CLOSI|nr:hypothetical protein CSKR_200020 [Clonorchis sinensis]